MYDNYVDTIADTAIQLLIIYFVVHIKFLKNVKPWAKLKMNYQL